MQIIVESRDADATPMRELSIARVRFALRRLKALVPRAKVQFSDVNGPRGGIDKRCQVELKTDSAGARLAHCAGPFHRTGHPGPDAQPSAQPEACPRPHREARPRGLP